MSKPHKTNTLLNCINEIISGISALNMPDEIKNNKADFISEKYVYANHAMEHFREAFMELNEIVNQINTIKWLLIMACKTTTDLETKSKISQIYRLLEELK